jgi:hypothetical protein
MSIFPDHALACITPDSLTESVGAAAFWQGSVAYANGVRRASAPGDHPGAERLTLRFQGDIQ